MDIATLLLVLLLLNLGLCGALLASGARNWAGGRAVLADSWSALLLARQLQSAGWALLLLHAWLPQLAGALPGELFVAAGVALEIGGLWRGQGRVNWRRWSALAAAGLLGLIVFDLVAPRDNLTVHAPATMLMALLFLAGGVRLLAPMLPESPLRRHFGAALSALAVITLTACVSGPWFDLSVAPAYEAVAMLGLFLLSLSGGVAHFVFAREAQEREVARMAIVDPLTDAPNRRGFFNALTPWMALARRPGQATAIIFLDLDHFKRINDTYGHAVGDMVLKSVVEIVKKQLRDSDLIGRFGGAEFAILLPRTALPEAEIVADRIRGAIDAMPIKTDRAVLSVTASLGLTTIAAHDSIVTLFKRVDQALAAAKQAGRNQVKVAMHAEAA